MKRTVLKSDCKFINEWTPIRWEVSHWEGDDESDGSFCVFCDGNLYVSDSNTARLLAGSLLEFASEMEKAPNES